MLNNDLNSDYRLTRGIAGAMAVAREYEIPLRLVKTSLAVVVFAAALAISSGTHFRLPGHSIVLWMPALMAGRALCGYRGSALAISACGGVWINVSRVAPDGRVFGYLLAALAIEGVLILIHKGPGFILGILMGMLANLGKMLPKVATVLLAGGTPHHSRATLPYMLTSYLVFGALAGFVCVAIPKVKERIREGKRKT